MRERLLSRHGREERLRNFDDFRKVVKKSKFNARRRLTIGCLRQGLGYTLDPWVLFLVLGNSVAPMSAVLLGIP